MNSIRLIVRSFPAIIFWASIVVLSLLLSHNAVLYFTHGGEYGILPEKLEARKDWLWTLCFYVHLPAGILCLIIPWISFARNRSSFFRKIHQYSGRIYVWITLLLVCPTGIYLAFFAKGGLVTKAGFILQASLLAWYTYRGHRSIREGDYANHVNAMIRSYSVGAVVLSFRILHLLFFVLNVPYHHNYAISQWLGLTINLLFAELVITNRINKSYQIKNNTL